MIKDVMERDMINEISTLFVMIFTSGLMFVMPILDIGYNDILVIIGFGILLSFMLTIIPILLSYDIRDEIIELIEDLDNQIVVDTWIHVDQIPKLVHVLKLVLYHLKYIDLRFLILDLYLNPSAHDHLPVLPNPPSPLSVYPRSSNDFT